MTDTRKKVVIITLFSLRNYGSMLQAYALQEYLRNRGYDAASTHMMNRSGFLLRAARRLIGSLQRLVATPSQTMKVIRKPSLFGKKAMEFFRYARVSRDKQIGSQRELYTQEFTDRYIKLVRGKDLAEETSKDRYHAIIVGSDQVWRRAGITVTNYLLDFAENWDVIRLSYSASFGSDQLSAYPTRLRARTAELARKFSAISLREASALDSVHKYWGVDADWHIDPTLLLDADHYKELIAADDALISRSSGQVFEFFLSPNEVDKEASAFVCESLGLKPLRIMPPGVSMDRRDNILSEIENYRYPRVTEWLNSFVDSGFVVSNSFHATVFSLIFHRPFISVGSKPGTERIAALLKMFGLEHRLIRTASEITDDILNEEIDWEKVDQVIESERARTLEYFDRYLPAQ